MHDRGEDLLPGKAAQGEMLTHPGADIREAVGEGQHVTVLCAVANLAEPRMIAVLLAAAGIPTSRLDVTIWLGADPYIRPCRRHGQGFDALQGRLVRDLRALRALVPEA